MKKLGPFSSIEWTVWYVGAYSHGVRRSFVCRIATLRVKGARLRIQGARLVARGSFPTG